MPAWLALPATGRQVLLTHEITHLATGSAGDANVPLWLVEGFADYVGLLRSGLRVDSVAAAVLDPVRSGQPAPAALPADRAFDAGSAEEMIANCDVLVTQYSSTVFVGLALGKECHSYFDPAELRRLMPVQNASAARNIADVCRAVLSEAPETVASSRWAGPAQTAGAEAP